MIVRSLVLLLLGLLQAGVHAQADSVLLAKADTLRVHKEWKSARKVYDGLIERHALETKARTGRALCNMWLNEDQAIVMADLNEAVRLDPKDVAALGYRSHRYYLNGMYDRAIADLDVILATSTDTAVLASAHSDRATDLLHLRRFADCRKDLEQLFALDSTDCGGMNTMANCLREEGRIDECFAWSERFIACDTNAMEGYANMAFYLGENGRYAEAIDWFAKAQRHGADASALFWNNRGYAKLRTGDIAGALKDVRQSIKMNPNNSYAYRNLALVHIAENKKDEACTALEEALRRGFTREYGNEVKDLYTTHCK